MHSQKRPRGEIVANGILHTLFTAAGASALGISYGVYNMITRDVLEPSLPYAEPITYASLGTAAVSGVALGVAAIVASRDS